MFAVYHPQILFLVPTIQCRSGTCENPRCDCRMFEITLHFFVWTIGIAWQCGDGEGGPV